MTTRLGSTSPGRRQASVLVIGCALAGSGVLALILFVFHNFGDPNDFPHELWPAYRALEHGHLRESARLAPSYIGAAVWRAPIALVAMACGAGWRVTYFLTAIPCFAAPPLLALWWRGRGAPARFTLTICALMVLDPLAWFAGIQGHPEELVGIALMLAAVVCASREQWWAAATLFLLAVLNKPALVIAAPILLLGVPERRLRGLLVAVLVFALLLLVLPVNDILSHLPLGHEDLPSAARGVPFDLLWWTGSESWFIRSAHSLVFLAAVGLTLIWRLCHSARTDAAAVGTTSARTVQSQSRVDQLLWLTALLLLIRTTFEPGNTTYYGLPLVFCLLCLERTRRVPVLALLASLGTLLLVPLNRVVPVGATGQAVLYTVAVIPALALVLVVNLPPVSVLRRELTRESRL